MGGGKKTKRTFQDEKMLTTGHRFQSRHFSLPLELSQELIKVIKYLGRSTRRRKIFRGTEKFSESKINGTQIAYLASIDGSSFKD